MDVGTNTTSTIEGIDVANLLASTVIQAIVSEDIKEHITFSLHFVIHFIIQVVGIFANAITINVFLKAGLDDSVTVSFFALAISDLLYLVSYMASRIPQLMDLELPFSKIPYILTFYNAPFLDVSVLITVFTAVQKSCCVAIPFLFKNIFTRRVSVYVVVFIYVLVIGSYVPFLSSHGFELKFSEDKNATVLTYVRLMRRTEAFYYWRLLNRTVLPVIAQILVFVSAVILTVKLKSSVRFRQSANVDNNSSASEKTQVGSNEKRVIQMVNIVTIIFFVCNLPEMVLHLTSLVYPEFRRGVRYKNLYRVLSSFQNTLFMLNASVNILVYLKYNSKFYNAFKTMHKSCPVCLSRKEPTVQK